MKTREGFVSNSSTSSFIIVGFDVPKKDIDILKVVDLFPSINKEEFVAADASDRAEMLYDARNSGDSDILYCDNSSDGYAIKGHAVVGVVIINCDPVDDGFESSMSLSDAIDRTEEIRETLGLSQDIEAVIRSGVVAS